MPFLVAQPSNPRAMSLLKDELTLPAGWTSGITLTQFETWIKVALSLELTGSFLKFENLDKSMQKYFSNYYSGCTQLHFYKQDHYLVVVSSGGAKVWEVLYYGTPVAVPTACRFDASKKCWYIHRVDEEDLM